MQSNYSVDVKNTNGKDHSILVETSSIAAEMYSKKDSFLGQVLELAELGNGVESTKLGGQDTLKTLRELFNKTKTVSIGKQRGEI